MQKERFIVIPNKKELDNYVKNGITSFILPLEDYSIGFDVYFSTNEINELSSKYNVYVMMNKFLHSKINTINEDVFSKLDSNIKVMCEDIGLIEVIDPKRIVLYEHHILSNYQAINYLYKNDVVNVVINNDLTIDEIKEIHSNTLSNLYYFYVAKNNLMYSRRNLVTNFDKNFDIEHEDKTYELSEKVSKNILEVKEESDGSVIKNHKIFCASKYLDEFRDINLIIDFSSINDVSEGIILDNLDNVELYNLIDSDYYFLENDIKYKVGDLKRNMSYYYLLEI